MSHIAGQQVGSEEQYRGHSVIVTYYGPDCLAYVDGQQVGDFWIDVNAARMGARKQIDQVEDEKAKARRKA